MATTRQVVQKAIDDSIREDRVTRVRPYDLPDGATLQDAIDVLSTMDGVEGSVRADEHEVWGTSPEGEWRVHVVV